MKEFGGNNRIGLVIVTSSYHFDGDVEQTIMDYAKSLITDGIVENIQGKNKQVLMVGNVL
jgi:hypothetical protein